MDNETKIIVFEHTLNGWNNHVKEEVEFDVDADEKEIEQAFEDWVWDKIGDKVTWYEKK